MKRKKTTRSNRNNRLEEAVALLMQNQATFLARLSETDKELANLRRQTDERFARIETILLEHSRILLEVMRMLEALPEAVRQKIGFKPQK
jgi:hypothetical protein